MQSTKPYVAFCVLFNNLVCCRSKAKELFPSLLDIYVSGGLAAGESPSHCMQKECLEEASLPEEMSRRYVKPVSCVTYVYEDSLGVHPEVGRYIQ